MGRVVVKKREINNVVAFTVESDYLIIFLPFRIYMPCCNALILLPI